MLVLCPPGWAEHEHRQTDPVQSEVAARIPGAAALGLVLPPGADVVPGTYLTDPGWTADVLDRRSRWQRTGDPRVLATVWWYSASTVLLTPVLAGLVTGRPLSARLGDTSVALLPGGHPVAAESSAAGGDPAAELRETLARVIAAVAETGRMRQRPLWAIATDSLANQLLALGRALGDVPAATALAGPLAAAIGPPLPVPRYVDVGRARFTRRASCCLLVEVPGQAMCTSCPRRPPEERRTLLQRQLWP
jgi:ferric iron reductase protein FhuF